MNKEIRDYQESMFWGLSFRQCLFSVLAILAALGIYFLTRKYAGEQVTGWLCVLGAAPFAACGFFRYHGMTAEQFAWTVLWSSIFVTLMANKIGGLQFGIYRNCQISSRVFHTAVAALPLTKANRSDFE